MLELAMYVVEYASLTIMVAWYGVVVVSVSISIRAMLAAQLRDRQYHVCMMASGRR